MSAAALRERLRSQRLYASEGATPGVRARAVELVKRTAMATGATSVLGRPLQFRYLGYKIPHDLAEMTGAGAESWEEIAFDHLDLYRRWCPIEPHHRILEIGCGIGRDAMHLAGLLSSKGSYLGIDIVRPSIEWCRRNISERHPNFAFEVLDVVSDMYNPAGTGANADVRFPVGDNSFDRIVLHSVFTHMHAPDIAHYLTEIARVLRPEGLVLASVFVLDDDTLQVAARHDGPLTFAHPLGTGCWANDPEHPEAALGYSLELLEAITADAGLVIDQLHQGFWCGREVPAPNGQDVLICRHA